MDFMYVWAFASLAAVALAALGCLVLWSHARTEALVEQHEREMEEREAACAEESERAHRLYDLAASAQQGVRSIRLRIRLAGLPDESSVVFEGTAASIHLVAMLGNGGTLGWYDVLQVGGVAVEALPIFETLPAVEAFYDDDDDDQADDDDEGNSAYPPASTERNEEGRHRRRGRASIFGRAARRGNIARTPTTAASQVLAEITRRATARGTATVPTRRSVTA